MNLAWALIAVTAALTSCSLRSSTESQPPFQGAFDLQVPGVVAATGLCSADFDGDGRPDLVTLSGSTARIKILLNKPGGFREAEELDAGKSACSVALGDFNEDGKIDLAVCHHDTDELRVFLGEGTGSFQPPSKIVVPVKKPHAHKLLSADMNKDGHDDLLLAQADDNQLWILLGDGKGGFAPSPQSPFKTGNHPYGVAASDFNADGQPDFATPNWYGKSVSIFLGGEPGAFSEAPNSPLSGISGPTAVSAADLTGDGKPDLAVCNDDSSEVQILVGDGKGGFAPATILRGHEDYFAPILADLDGDGKIDVIATACNSAQAFNYWINLGGGKFSAAHSLPCAALANTICVADLNGDGAVDLAVGTSEEAKTCIWFGKRGER